MGSFFQYCLRTTDEAAARAFYAAVLGRDDAVVARLPDQALARGARPHWLGFIGVSDFDEAIAGFCGRGATPLGPRGVGPTGSEMAVLRDPGGAVVALAQQPHQLRSGPEVAWHVLNTNDVQAAERNYGELFGWQIGEPRELGVGEKLTAHELSSDGEPFGLMLDIAARPAVHPHWLFHFRVASLDASLSAVREHGGLALPVLSLPNGARVAVCDDAQGAAFALYEAPPTPIS